jgi:hypothetical protein
LRVVALFFLAPVPRDPTDSSSRRGARPLHEAAENLFIFKGQVFHLIPATQCGRKKARFRGDKPVDNGDNSQRLCRGNMVVKIAS